MKKNDVVIETILSLVNGYRNMSQSDTKDLDGIRYLIGQTIRAYNVARNQVHISREAWNLWNSLTSADINDFFYRESFDCDRVQAQRKIELYKGAERKPSSSIFVKNCDSLIFRNVFHLDHIVPVSLIEDEILKLSDPTKEDIKIILDKMHLCRVLKSENTELGRTKGRGLDWQENVKNVYNAKGVYILP